MIKHRNYQLLWEISLATSSSYDKNIRTMDCMFATIPHKRWNIQTLCARSGPFLSTVPITIWHRYWHSAKTCRSVHSYGGTPTLCQNRSIDRRVFLHPMPSFFPQCDRLHNFTSWQQTMEVTATTKTPYKRKAKLSDKRKIFARDARVSRPWERVASHLDYNSLKFGLSRRWAPRGNRLVLF